MAENDEAWRWGVAGVVTERGEVGCTAGGVADVELVAWGGESCG